ncbi:cation:proton antiporter [Maritalea mediterranea]|uniref:Sodium:proton antiporter n=1 Tax=Maritalea mediterranea TaxID=2909667 RepID=A0ABS9EAP6_9HYPH|nr:sodium:proton antiporter [Maritalea mediterranea]MCF4099938.1 sodium:proton antiporter [Maritalea mediterranea]
MSHSFQFALILFGIMGFALFVRPIERSWITLPIFFAGLGFVLGPAGLGFIDLDLQDSTIHTVAEITLIFTLFLDASKIRLRNLKAHYGLPARMLLVGMPLTILLGTGLILLLAPDLPWAMALLTAAILTPTDAALAQPILADKDVPPRIAEAINVESGLNDGLALPVVVFAALLMANEATRDISLTPFGVSQFVGAQIIFGPLAGIVVGYCGAKLLDLATHHKFTQPIYEGIFFLSVGLAAFFGAETVGGNGFIAAFVAGLTFGNTKKTNHKFITEFLEGESNFLSILTFMIFGAVLAPVGLAHANWTTLLIAVSFLTLIRMAPIALSLVGKKLHLYERFILGWFGPKGLASILFALFVAEQYDMPHIDQMLACTVLTVGLSILAHGLSAKPLAHHFEKTMQKVKSQ